MGQTIVIISGGFDLSVGAVSAATGMAAAWMLQQGYGFFTALFTAIIIGGIIGVGKEFLWAIVFSFYTFILQLCTYLLIGLN